MANTIKIGFLAPYSGVYPFYSHHIIAGMLLGLYPGDVNAAEFQFVHAYTQMGDPKSTLEAVNKLVFFEQCDIISGLISYSAVPGIIPVIETYHKLAFFFDMGELIPYFGQLCPQVFYSSQQIWQSQFALGQWAQKEFGGTGMMVMPLYEAGYHLSSAFHKGVGAGGATQVGLHVLPRDPANIRNLDLDKFFADIRKNPPNYIHAIFSGNFGKEFLVRWRKSEFYKSIPLTVVENMVYDELFSEVAETDMEIYAASTWSSTAENVKNKQFVSRYGSTGGRKANIYGLLGYEAGLALHEVKPHLLKGDFKTAITLLQKESITGPRGERNFYPLSGFSLPVIDILRVKTSSGKIYKTILGQGNGLKFDDAAFIEIHEESVSGWQNPYMCI